MTVERAFYVVLPDELSAELHQLQERADAAMRRSSKLPPGETSEIARFEALSSQIERRVIAFATLNPQWVAHQGELPQVNRTLLGKETLTKQGHGLPLVVASLIDVGKTVAVIGRPHRPGETVVEEGGTGPRPPAEAWLSTRKGKGEAQTERFEALLQAALDLAGGKTAVDPLSVSNRVLTEALRRFAASEPGRRRVDVSIEYRDGSVAPPFPLGAVAMGGKPLPDWPVLKVTLLSMRHVEMDQVVHGAWFRNARISRSGPTGLLDADAFSISLDQLARLRATGPRIIEMYQTGFQPAVTAFYRAVAHALIEHPNSVCVVPRYFVRTGFEEGTPWRTA